MAITLFHQPNDHRLDRLADVPMLRGASRAELLKLGRLLEEATIAAGQRVRGPGDPAVLVIVVDGLLTDGDRLHGAGAVWGLDTVLGDAPAGTLWAVEPSTILVADVRRARGALQTSPSLTMGLLRTLAAAPPAA